MTAIFSKAKKYLFGTLLVCLASFSWSTETKAKTHMSAQEYKTMILHEKHMNEAFEQEVNVYKNKVKWYALHACTIRGAGSVLEITEDNNESAPENAFIAHCGIVKTGVEKAQIEVVPPSNIKEPRRGPFIDVWYNKHKKDLQELAKYNFPYL